jgi:hypothetical protein
MGEPGEPFTVSVNGGNEWFAARRKDYYVVTFHGRLAPTWLVNGFYGQIGFSGGILCQLYVPGKGLVFHSRLKGHYGQGMDLPSWRNFEIHSVVGTMADGRPFVGAVSEHMNARLDGNVVESSGEVRDRPVHITRRYAFNDDHIVCEARLAGSGYTPLLTLWSRDRAASVGLMKEAWEMIPYARGQAEKQRSRKGELAPIQVRLLGADNKVLGGLSTELVENVSRIDVQREGYGAVVHLTSPAAVKKGESDTILIRLINKVSAPDKISVSYRIVPYRK